MSVTVELPAACRRHAGDQRQVLLDVDGRLHEVLGCLCKRFAGLKSQLLAPDDQPYASIAMFINGVDARAMQGLDTHLASGDVLTLVPAISGG